MTEVDHTSPYEKAFLEGLYEKLCNDVADVVIRKLTDSSSNMLNTIQYKVRAENIEGQIQASQIDGLDDMIDDAITDKVKEIASDAAERYINELTFEVTVR